MGRKINKAFTLTEILIVVSIISFLILLTTIYLRTQIFKGNDARRKADLARIKVAVEEYEKDNDCYPLLSLLDCEPGTGLKPYLDKIPCDPVSGAAYAYEYEGEYEGETCPAWFRIYAKLENDKDKDAIYGIGPNHAYNFYLSSPNAPLVEGLPTPIGGGTPTPEPPPEFWGCINGDCLPIARDPDRPPPGGAVCDPSFGSIAACNTVCGVTVFVCTPWH